jgi:hypothetical protein
VLDGAQEAVRGDQGRGVVPADVAAGRQGVQRGQGAADPQRGIGPAVHHLQQLDGEFDVAQTTAPELELPFRLGRRDVRLDPPAHGLHLADEPGAVAGRPHQRPERLDVGVPEVRIPGHRPHLEQGLELPGAGPLLVVGLVTGEGAHERAGLALGAQRRVDLPGRLPADPHEGRGGLRRRRDRRALRIAGIHRLGDEDDVDIAHIVQLATARLAHGDDRQAARCGGGRLLRDGQRQPGGQDGGRDVGELGGGLLGRQPVAEVTAGQRQDRPAVGLPEGADALRRRVRRPLAQAHAPGRVVGIGADRLEHVALELARRRSARAGGVPVGVVVQDRPVPGVGGEVVGQAGARAEHREQAPAQQGRAAQARQHGRGRRPGGVGGVECLDEAVQRADGEVGVAGPRQRRDHRPRLGVGGLVALEVPQPEGGVGEQAGGAFAVLEAEPGQPDDGAPRNLHLCGHGVRRPGSRGRGRGRRTGW